MHEVSVPCDPTVVCKNCSNILSVTNRLGAHFHVNTFLVIIQELDKIMDTTHCC